MTDVHIKRNIISADYAVVPDTLIHLILKGKILRVEGHLVYSVWLRVKYTK
jgi:hypothetical protein